MFRPSLQGPLLRKSAVSSGSYPRLGVRTQPGLLDLSAYTALITLVSATDSFCDLTQVRVSQPLSLPIRKWQIWEGSQKPIIPTQVEVATVEDTQFT